jgi:predicted NAD-dependent protein-ADP-ribosyltransferase YbiA (DUF1768 family)
MSELLEMSNPIFNLNIFNEKSKPFGRLSNKSISNIEYEGTKWPSPTNYIYANMFWDLSIRNILQHMSIKRKEDYINLHKFYIEKSKNIREDIIESALNIAINMRFKNDEDFKQKLIQTGNKSLVYNSIGVLGASDDGDNLYGKFLSMYRDNLSYADRTDTEKNDRIFLISRAFDALVYELTINGKDVKKLFNKRYDEILLTLDIKHHETQEEVIKQYEDGTLDKIIMQEVANPNKFVQKIRRRYIDDAINKNKNMRKKIIIETYLTTLININYPQLTKSTDHTYMIDETIKNMSETQYTSIFERVISLYNNKAFPKRTMYKIKVNLSENPSFENTLREEEVEELEEAEEEIYNIEQDDILSPSYNTELEINGYNFSSITHYILTRLLADVPKDDYSDRIGMIDAYNKYNPSNMNVEDFNILYTNVYNNSARNRMVRNAEKIMNEKFLQHDFQTLLVHTGNSNILYTDKTNKILGIDGDDGENIVGRILMDIRDRVKQVYVMNDISVGDVYEINKIPKLKEWIFTRSVDMNTSIVLYTNYIRSHTNYTESTPSTDIISRFIYNIYQPCSNTRDKLVSVTRTEAPEFYINQMSEYNVSIDTIRTFWNFLSFMIYYIVEKYDKDTREERIMNDIYTAKNYVSAKHESVNNNDVMKNIIFAIMNVLINVVNTNIAKLNNHVVGKAEVYLALSIILGHEIKEFHKLTQVEHQYIYTDIQNVLNGLDQTHYNIINFDETTYTLYFGMVYLFNNMNHTNVKNRVNFFRN